MITKRTVLVLGAGASIDYGFPSGWQLLRTVIQETAEGDGIYRLLAALRFSPTSIATFREALSQSAVQSIDAFLGDRLDCVNIGKAAIAAALIPHEHPSTIHALGAQPSWLHILSERLGAGRDMWRENRLSIVTFNYDRVVEYFLHSMLVSRFRLSTRDAAELLKSTIPIVHVHGQLGSLFTDDNDLARPFEPTLDAGTVEAAAAGIRIIHEGSEADEVFLQARQLLSEAEEIVLMGFGFHPTNIERLALGQHLHGRTVLASCIKMAEQQRKTAAKRAPGLYFDEKNCSNLTDFILENAILGI